MTSRSYAAQATCRTCGGDTFRPEAYTARRPALRCWGCSWVVGRCTCPPVTAEDAMDTDDSDHVPTTTRDRLAAALHAVPRPASEPCNHEDGPWGTGWVQCERDADAILAAAPDLSRDARWDEHRKAMLDALNRGHAEEHAAGRLPKPCAICRRQRDVPAIADSDEAPDLSRDAEVARPDGWGERWCVCGHRFREHHSTAGWCGECGCGQVRFALQAPTTPAEDASCDCGQDHDDDDQVPNPEPSDEYPRGLR